LMRTADHKTEMFTGLPADVSLPHCRILPGRRITRVGTAQRGKVPSKLLRLSTTS
jgi:hypothetical protein